MRSTGRTDGLSSTQTVLIVLGALGAGFLLVVGILAAMLVPALARAREEARRIRCRTHLNWLAKGMATYLNEHGDNRWYPCPLGLGTRPDDYNGAEWLASLYWAGALTDPTAFLCPSTDDTNADGQDLGTRAVPDRFGPQTVSYAAMHFRSGGPGRGHAGTGHRQLAFPGWGGTTQYRIATDASGRVVPGAIRDDFPPNMPMASDDTQGPIHHGRSNNGGMSVLFFDSHVEFKTHIEVDLECGVGSRTGLLCQLRN